MRRISSFDEMPYDEAMLDVIRKEGERFAPGPQRDAYRILMQTLQMDLNRGGVIRRSVIEPILRELEELLEGGPTSSEENILRENISLYSSWNDELKIAQSNLRELERIFRDHDKISLVAIMRTTASRVEEARRIVTDWLLANSQALNRLVEERR